MKIIKFRAWDGEKMYYKASTMFCLCQLSGEIKFYRDDGVHLPNVMQFTGAKDEEGQEIYEGDIIEDEEGDTFVVAWSEFMWTLEMRPYISKSHDWCLWQLQSKDGSCIETKVIGNIHENSELL